MDPDDASRILARLSFGIDDLTIDPAPKSFPLILYNCIFLSLRYEKIRTVFVRPGVSYSLIFDCFRFLIFVGVFVVVKLGFDDILTPNYFYRFSLDFTDFFAKCLCPIHGAYLHISPRALKICRFSMPFLSLFPAFWRRSTGCNGAQLLRRLAQPTGTREKTFGSGRDVRAAGAAKARASLSAPRRDVSPRLRCALVGQRASVRLCAFLCRLSGAAGAEVPVEARRDPQAPRRPLRRISEPAHRSLRLPFWVRFGLVLFPLY